MRERLEYWAERRKELQQSPTDDGLSGRAGNREQADMYQTDQGAYWQAQLMFWGPKILIALLIIVATWIVARAVKWVLQKAIDRSPALKKHVTGTPEETVGHQLGDHRQADHLAGRHHGRAALSRGRRRSSTRSTR